VRIEPSVKVVWPMGWALSLFMVGVSKEGGPAGQTPVVKCGHFMAGLRKRRACSPSAVKAVGRGMFGAVMQMIKQPASRL
jgi:hypothetical protein